MPVREVHNFDDIQNLRDVVRQRAQLARDELGNLNPVGMEASYRIKFSDCGYHPLENRRLDFIEQLNQTFTYMASFAAARKLMQWFPNCPGLRLNLGTRGGWDIESIGSCLVHAEVFTAKDPRNNNKLAKDIKRLQSRSNADHRYVFFFVPSYDAGRQHDLERTLTDGNIEIWALGRTEIM